MKTSIRIVFASPLAMVIVISLAFTPVMYGPVAYAQSYSAAPGRPALGQQLLDQMLAPIALYPDPLLSQILMASTYPLEVVEAARWLGAHPNLKGDGAVRAVESMDWDPSVKSLVAFPQIVTMMDQKLDWTEKLGDAFLAQQPQVMDTVQRLRQRAYAAGSLRTNDRIRLVMQGQLIAIEPAIPGVVYIPYYDPMVIYGPWWWPAYPPVYWAPWPGYYVRPGVTVGFVWDGGIGISAGFLFGAFDWYRHETMVVNANNYYSNRNAIVNRQANAPNNIAPGIWRHDPNHRRGVAYQEASLRQKFGQADASPEARQREPAAVNNSPAERRDTRAPAARAESNTTTRPDMREQNDNRPDPRNIRGSASRPETNAGARPDVREQKHDGRANARPAGTARQNVSQSELRNSPIHRADPRVESRTETLARPRGRSEARTQSTDMVRRASTSGFARTATSDARAPIVRGNSSVPTATKSRPSPRRTEAAS